MKKLLGIILIICWSIQLAVLIAGVELSKFVVGISFLVNLLYGVKFYIEGLKE